MPDRMCQRPTPAQGAACFLLKLRLVASAAKNQVDEALRWLSDPQVAGCTFEVAVGLWGYALIEELIDAGAISVQRGGLWAVPCAED